MPAASAAVSLPPLAPPSAAASAASRPVTAPESLHDPESPSRGESVPQHESLAAPKDLDGLVDDAVRRCTDYVFKQRVTNRAFIRMVVYAKYGPGVRQPDGSVHLSGAHRVLNGFEEKQLLVDEADAFITDVYGGTLSSTSLTGTRRAVDDESRGAMTRMKDKLATDAMEMTRTELAQVLAQTVNLVGANSKHRSLDGSGYVHDARRRQRDLKAASSTKSTPTDFITPAARANTAGEQQARRLPTGVADAVSTALLAERRRRIAALKRSTPDRERVRTDVDVTQRATRHFYNKTAPKAYRLRSFEDPKDVLRSLHRYAGTIVDPDDKNNVAVTLNVRCLRPEFVPDPDRPGWDGFCCVRQQAPSKISTLR